MLHVGNLVRFVDSVAIVQLFVLICKVKIVDVECRRVVLWFPEELVIILLLKHVYTMSFLQLFISTPLFLHKLKLQTKLTPQIQFRINPYFSRVLIYKLLCNHKSQTYPIDILPWCLLNEPKEFKKFVLILFADARARVLHGNVQVLFIIWHINRDWSAFREFYCVWL